MPLGAVGPPFTTDTVSGYPTTVNNHYIQPSPPQGGNPLGTSAVGHQTTFQSYQLPPKSGIPNQLSPLQGGNPTGVPVYYQPLVPPRISAVGPRFTTHPVSGYLTTVNNQYIQPFPPQSVKPNNQPLPPQTAVVSAPVAESNSFARNVKILKWVGISSLLGLIAGVVCVILIGVLVMTIPICMAIGIAVLMVTNFTRLFCTVGCDCNKCAC